MKYYFSKIIEMSFSEALAHVTKALAAKGFSVLTTIDVSETIRSKLGVEFTPYTILGACNPHLALRALEIEDKIGTMLPCNVIVREAAPGKVEVAAVDPVASMSTISNAKLDDVATGVRDLLDDIIRQL